MACINPDGTLTRPAIKILNAMRAPATLAQVATDSGVPLYRVRSVIREITEGGLVDVNGELYSTTPLALEKLENK